MSKKTMSDKCRINEFSKNKSCKNKPKFQKNTNKKLINEIKKNKNIKNIDKNLDFNEDKTYNENKKMKEYVKFLHLIGDWEGD